MKKPSRRKKASVSGARKSPANKTSGASPDELLPEYSGALVRGGVRGKYAADYSPNASLVLLDPDVARAFPNAEAVNNALRDYLKRRPR